MTSDSIGKRGKHRIGFPIFGVLDEWVSNRWLASIQDDGESIWRATLAHTDDLTTRWMLVSTAKRQGASPTSSANLADGGPLGAAWQTAFSLVNATWPDEWSPERVAQYRSAAMAFVDHHAEHPDSWEAGTWMVSGELLTSSFLRFAGAWAGHAQIDGKIRLQVVGFGVDPTDIALAEVFSGDYYFDMDDLDTMSASRSRQAALGALTNPIKVPLHEDHSRLMAGNS